MVQGLHVWPQEVPEPDADAVVGVPREVVVAELLELCDGFFATAGPVVVVELKRS